MASWALLGNVLKPCWGRLEGVFAPSWGRHWGCRAGHGAVWGGVQAIPKTCEGADIFQMFVDSRGRPGASLQRFWDVSGPHWAVFGSSWTVFEAVLDFGVVLRPSRAIVGPYGVVEPSLVRL